MQTTLNISDNISADIFRAYDIRGKVDETLTAEVVYTLGLAIGSEARERGLTKIVIGRDGRLSGPELFSALTQGLLATGMNVIDIGMAPTPVLYFATHCLRIYSGVMLTGSHNPSDYNGLKIILNKQTLAADDIQKLYARVRKRQFTQGVGKLTTEAIISHYLTRIAQDVKLKRPFKIVVDCGNGISGIVAPPLFRNLGCEVIELFTEIDGRFPNHHPDPAVLNNLKDLIITVKKVKADIGLAFDGDGDRVGVVTDQGEVIWPDRQLMLLAKDVLKRHPQAPIVFDVKCTKHLSAVIEQFGGKPIMWKTGHSILKAKMQEIHAPLAGELSGHIFFQERWYGFDDGMYAAARLLEILAQETETVSQVFQQLPNSINTPELKLPVVEENKFQLMQAIVDKVKFIDAKIDTIDGLRADFTDGWGLIRPSNTTPYLVLRFEADDQQALVKIQEKFRQQLLLIDANLPLPF